MPKKKKPDNLIMRKVGNVTATITWPGDERDWWSLNGDVRNRIRYLLDQASDLIADQAPQPRVESSTTDRKITEVFQDSGTLVSQHTKGKHGQG